uniref:Transposase Tc1-like domain-containing protein n=1 Tax=Anabas testudineus TaxID=64144 RepID=A0A3Q1HCR9_ANATE
MLKDLLEQVNISLHNSTVCKTLNRLSKQNTACLKIGKNHIDTPQHYCGGSIILWGCFGEMNSPVYQGLSRVAWCSGIKGRVGNSQ